MGLTNHILWNVIGVIFHQLKNRAESNNSQLIVIKSNHEIIFNKFEPKTGTNEFKSNNRTN